MDSVELLRLHEHLVVVGDRSGICFCAQGMQLIEPDKWPHPLTPLGRKFALWLPVLVRNGHADSTAEGVSLSYEQLAALPDEEARLFDGLCRWSPFSVELSSHGALGYPDFRFRVRFVLGDLDVSPIRVGAFLRLQATVYRVGERTRRLLDLAADMNAWAEERRTNHQEVLLRWGEMRSLALESGAELDDYLSGEQVIAPGQVHLDLAVDASERVSVVPSFDNVPEEPLHREYLRFGRVQDVYTVPQKDGKRLRVVIRPEVSRALERVRDQRRLTGRAKDHVLSAPQILVGDNPEGVVADLLRFGPRVKGIGPYPAYVRAFVSSGERWTDIGAEAGSTQTPRAALECVDYDGERREIPFETVEAAKTLLESLRTARNNAEPTVDFAGFKLPTSATLICQLEEVVGRLTPSPSQESQQEDTQEKPERQRAVGVLVYDAPEYAETVGGGASPRVPTYPLPSALRPGVVLKPHQREGISWLQHNFALGNRKGVLLADDMGLGKTLQALAFLAWLVEHPLRDTLGHERGPYAPILVVAPLVLLDDLGWKGQLEKFLQGSVLMPYVVLHGKEIAAHRRESGAERLEARPLLDLERLQENRLLITNYETLANYQLSVSTLRWSVVVADEAHFFKEPDTKISFTMKALDAEFRVALTGTPVQNRLRDLWNIVDFLQPGGVLGSAKEFEERFERSGGEGGVPEERLGLLRQRLGIGRADGMLLRRTKEAHLPGLPPKQSHRATVPLSDSQRSAHLACVQDHRTRHTGPGWVFGLLMSLNKLSQHPALVGQGSVLDPVGSLIAGCPKLGAMLDELRQVSARTEKALVFAFFRDMQQILKRVIDETFGLDVDIMNGQSGQSGTQLVARRSDMIRRFESRPGFNVLILSPEVAGVGLNIVAANHVFHYGRWWNPAVEDQATDRVHRIGQERDVHVHYLVATDPQGRFRTFDERLDALIERKRKGARDFLEPQDAPNALGEQLASELLGDQSVHEEPAGPLPAIGTEEDVRRLDPVELQAVVAAMFERWGYTAILTPRLEGRGIDLVATRRGETVLVRCHHADHHGSLLPDALGETLAAAAFYRENVLPLPHRAATRPVIIAASEVDRRIRKEAENQRVELVSGSLLRERLKAAGVSRIDAERLEGQRARTLDEVRGQLAGRG